MKPILESAPATAIPALVRRVVLPALMAALLAGCIAGARDVSGFAPRVELDSLQLNGEQLRMVVLLVNPNDHEIVLTGARFDLHVDEAELVARHWPLNLDVGPRNRERLALAAAAGPEGAARLSSLDDLSGDAKLPFTLVSELELSGQRNARAQTDGFIHPVPGQPGRYR